MTPFDQIWSVEQFYPRGVAENRSKRNRLYMKEESFIPFERMRMKRRDPKLYDDSNLSAFEKDINNPEEAESNDRCIKRRSSLHPTIKKGK